MSVIPRKYEGPPGITWAPPWLSVVAVAWLLYYVFQMVVDGAQ
jgi:hypothetical protein